ncbi:alanine dehydrogenase, partial [Candidatus Micrarchaeota archaeon]|nr:alanine dehydrogenase [Candidatus Micrarchaeota archaeon]
MNVGVLREIKDKENRVALTPEGAKQLVDVGHTVFFERKCGAGSGLKNRDYEVVGAKLVESPKELARECDLVVKVKEPVEEEHTYFDESKMLFTYFHFASSCELTENMLKSGAACIAYETVEDKNGKLPLLRPMSEVA